MRSVAQAACRVPAQAQLPTSFLHTECSPITTALRGEGAQRKCFDEIEQSSRPHLATYKARAG